MQKKVILLTGCSSGFGMLSAVMLAKNHIVYATMRNLDKQKYLKEEAGRLSRDIRILRLDVTNVDSIKNAIKVIQSEQGRLDVVINNAGYGLGGFFEDLNDKEIRDEIETNFYGVLNVTRESLPLLYKSDDARIINISSISGRVGYPGMSAYCAGKWAVEGFSETLRLELRQFGIKVILVEPGSFETKIFDENARFAENYDNTNSKYYKYSCFFNDRRKLLKNKRGNPMRVAKLIEKLVNKKHPGFRNIIGFDAYLVYYSKKILPFWLYERILSKIAFKKNGL
ncbi:MAG: SDR family NAD(P)-dependent oxidoreductase [Elusimicrobiota bacterium]